VSVVARVLSGIGALVVLVGFLLPLVMRSADLSDSSNATMLAGAFVAVVGVDLYVVERRVTRAKGDRPSKLRALGFAAVLVMASAVAVGLATFGLIILNWVVGSLLGIDGYGI
jgi:hypothetical protein